MGRENMFFVEKHSNDTLHNPQRAGTSHTDREIQAAASALGRDSVSVEAGHVRRARASARVTRVLDEGETVGDGAVVLGAATHPTSRRVRSYDAAVVRIDLAALPGGVNARIPTGTTPASQQAPRPAPRLDANSRWKTETRVAAGGTGGAAYGIPPDNPFVNRPEAAPEIWAWGLRHSQHISWDSSGRMFINDIGQNQVEEVNLGRAGANYGWRQREGTFATAFARNDGTPGLVYAEPPKADEFVDPVAQYDHDEGHAIGGGYLYEGSAIPALRGKFVFADIVTGRVFYIDGDDLQAGKQQTVRELRLSFGGTEQELAAIASISNTYRAGPRVDLRLGIDALGELYLVTKADGWIRKLMPLE